RSRHALRLGLALDLSPSNDAVEPFVAELDKAGAEARLQQLPTLGSMLAAHLEDVRVIRREADAERDVERFAREIPHVNALVAHALPDQLGAEDVKRAALDDDASARVEVRIREIR